MSDNLSLLHKRIREFIKKYYLNRLFKGAILFVIITLVLFIVVALLEYFSYFNTTVRTVLFYSYLAVFLFTFIYYILIPLFQIWGLGRQITKEKVAAIIGKHFKEIDDKLLNVIQLEDQLDNGEHKSYQLLMAAIDTKIENIKPFPFVKAIPFKETTRYLKWAMIPILLFILIFSIKSEVFTESAERIVKYQHYFEKPAPYTFEIMNDDLTGFQNEDFILRVKVNGTELPLEIYASYQDRNYKFTKISNSEFSYTFSKLQKNTNFQIITDEVSSKIYTLQVLPKPVTVSFVMQLDYPSYLNKNREIIENNGDATVPEGTTITWKFYTRNTDTLSFILHDKVQQFVPQQDNASFSYTARSSFDYSVLNSNTFFTSKDSIKHSISVVQDRYPEIYVESQRDSLFMDRVYFKGHIQDDYGFTSLKFVYSKYDDKGNLLESENRKDLEINTSANVQDFYHYFDAGLLQLDPGYRIEYYFEVRDNDAINGYKATRSQVNTYRVRTLEEVDRELANSQSQTKSDMNEILKESGNLVKDIERFYQQMMQTQNPSWQDKKKLESLLDKYNELQKSIEEIKRQQEQQNVLEDQFKNIPPDLLEKQRELQKRMDEILTDEMKQMIDNIQKMMDQLNKDQMKEAMDKMKSSTEEMSKSLDQQLQLFKQLEYEKKVNDIVEKVKELSSDQRLLSKESQQKNIPKDELIKKQDDLQKKFDQLREDMKSLEQLNNELEDPNKMTNTDDLQKKIDQSMQESKNALNKNNRSKASEKQEESAQSMEELADQMESDLLDSQEENLGEDIESIRQILDNLVRISFRQEENLVRVKSMNAGSSYLTQVIREQFTIQEHMKMIEDSLSSLARRQPQVQPFILKEVTNTREYIQKTLKSLNDRKLPLSASHQQFALTSMNNLALMLAESMKNMKDQMSQCQNAKNQKSGNCSKPGSGNKSGKTAKSARKLQQQLNRQMEALKRSMEQQGKQEGEQGQGGTQGQQLSEQLAKMAAQQEAIRKMMQDYQNEMKSQNGVGDKSLDQMIRDMEITEKELVNRIISQQTLNRQKNIETRLLESEKADMQREQEEKRESTEARDIRNLNPPKEWSMDKMSEKQNEMMKTVPVNLNYYYKEKVNQYFFNIE